MTWNEGAGTVSRTFDSWKGSDEQNRAFLKLSTQWSADAYDQTWKQAEAALNEVFDPDRHYGDEHVDIFDDAVDGLWPHDYHWLAEAAVLKNAVSSFEVYLEKGLQEILQPWRLTEDGQPHRFVLKTGGYESPTWGTLVRAYTLLDQAAETLTVNVNSGDVK
ncbi:hypothetical protein [Streptomyces sp. NPDC056525]